MTDNPDFLKKQFVDKYGNVIPYTKKSVKITAYWGIIWVYDKQENTVTCHISPRPYAGTGPARQWVNREKKYHTANKRFEVLDVNVITASELALLD